MEQTKKTESMQDQRKQEWIERWKQDNSSVRAGWIKRTDGRIGYVYLCSPDYIIRADFVKIKNVYRRVWVPCYKKYQIHELQHSSDLDTAMKDVERHVTEAGETHEAINHYEAEVI